MKKRGGRGGGVGNEKRGCEEWGDGIGNEERGRGRGEGRGSWS